MIQMTSREEIWFWRIRMVLKVTSWSGLRLATPPFQPAADYIFVVLVIDRIKIVNLSLGAS